MASEDFKGMPTYLRAQMTYPLRSDDRPVEILCFTPEEVRARLKSPVRGVLREALKTGVVV